MTDEPRDHVERARLPWRTEQLTECGRPVVDVASVIAVDQLKWRVKEWGKHCSPPSEGVSSSSFGDVPAEISFAGSVYCYTDGVYSGRHNRTAEHQRRVKTQRTGEDSEARQAKHRPSSQTWVYSGQLFG